YNDRTPSHGRPQGIAPTEDYAAKIVSSNACWYYEEGQIMKMATLSTREQANLAELKVPLPFGIKCARPVTPRGDDKDKDKTATQSPVWTSDGQNPDSGQMDWYADED